MTLFTDRIQGGLERALDGVSLRQRVTAQNVANAMTPGYRAQRVEFEGALAGALATGRPGGSPFTVSEVADHSNYERLDGNTVSLEDEATTAMRSGLQYQALIEASTFKFSVLRTAIQGR